MVVCCCFGVWCFGSMWLALLGLYYVARWCLCFVWVWVDCYTCFDALFGVLRSLLVLLRTDCVWCVDMVGFLLMLWWVFRWVWFICGLDLSFVDFG